jgi:choline monooxygenase
MTTTVAGMSVPARWYTDPAIFERERTQIFGRTWQWVGRVDQVSAPGAYFTCEVAGEPLVVVRGTDGQLRALWNVCRHKAAPVAEGSGTVRRFQCGYHGWTYGLDGTLLGTPHFSEGEGFRRADNGLPSARVATWGPLVFVNLDPEAEPLERVLAPVGDRFERYPLDELVFQRDLSLEIQCNWKVMAENLRECYHCPSVHPSLTAAYEVEETHPEPVGDLDIMFIAERCASPTEQRGAPKDAAILSFDRHRVHETLRDRERRGSYYIHLFPNLMLSLGPDHASALKLTPAAEDRVVWSRQYFSYPGLPAADPLDATWEFRLVAYREDKAICEEVQKGLRSRSYVRGWYSTKEPLIRHFHDLVLGRMVEEH